MIRSDTVLGISLTRSGGQAALVERRGWRRGPKVTSSSETVAHSLDFEETSLRPVFAALTRDLKRRARRADVPVCVSLPDPLVREDMLSFRSFPTAVTEANDLVRLRVRREIWADREDVVCAHEVIATEGDQTDVRVRSMSENMRNAVEASARAAGLHVWRLDSWSGYLSASLSDAADNGAVVWSDGDSWSVMCWCPEAPGGFLDCGWATEDAATLARRMWRLTQSFALKHGHSALPVTTDVPDDLARALTDAGARALPVGQAKKDALATAAKVALWA